MFITLKNFTVLFNNNILKIHQIYHTYLSTQYQNKLAIVYKTVVNRFLAGY